LIIQIVIAVQMYGCEIMFIIRLLKCLTACSLLLVMISSCSVSFSSRTWFVHYYIYYCYIWPNKSLCVYYALYVILSYFIQNTKQYLSKINPKSRRLLSRNLNHFFFKQRTQHIQTAAACDGNLISEFSIALQFF
jgi:hypothetical protein